MEKVYENNNLKLINQAERLIGFTLCGGLVIGLIGLIGYPLTIDKIGTRIVYIGLLMAIASLISGFLSALYLACPSEIMKKIVIIL